MTETRTLAARKLRPFYGRIIVLPSPVDDEERPSGIIVPIGLGGDEVCRGVVIAVDDDMPSIPGIVGTPLSVGMVVYYWRSKAADVLDAVVLEPRHVLAYEADE